MQVLEFNPKEFDDSKITIDGRVDAAFRKINRNTIGFHVWKVENDRVEAINKAKLGTFLDDSTYIIYAASVKGTYANHETISRDVKPPTPQIERFLHFWLGESTSTEKSGVVAYKVIEFDIHLGCTTTQYREVQGNESARFLSYFRQGITVMCGDYQNVSPNPEIKLFQIIGRKSFKCIQKRTIEWNHFNSGHVMLFQTKLYIYLWIGRSSSSSERLHGLETAMKLRDMANENGEKCEISIVDDGYEQSMKENRKNEWNNFLNLTQRFVQPALISPQHKNQIIPMKLFKCGHMNGKYRIEEIKTMMIEQSDLSDSDAAYIIDGEERGVWIWIGKNINTQEKAEAMRNARGFVKKKKYSSSTPVIRVVENHEPEEFIRLFPAWVEHHQDVMNNNNNNNNKMSSTLGKFDTLTLMQRPKLAAQTQLIDDGCGDLKIFRVDGNKLIELPKIANGSLFSGDVYIVIYEVILPENIKDLMVKLKHVIYLWMGKNSTANDKLNGCNLATEVCDRLGKSTLQIRLNEGHESAHFLQIFKGNLIIFNGQSIDFDASGMNMREPNYYVLKIFGNSTYTSKAVQVNGKTLYTSNDCFVLKTSGNDIWVWCGHCSTGDSREIAKSIGMSLGEYCLVIESNEPEEFWSTLSDKVAINFKRIRSNQIIPTNQKSLNNVVNNIKPALFVGYLENGNIAATQLIGFEQKDLSSDDIYLLDTGNIIYIWIGNTSAINEKLSSWQMASHLLTNAFVQREIRLPIAVVKQGYEPPTFMGFFDSWDIKLWNEHQTFDTLRNQIEPSPISILKNGHNHTNGVQNGKSSAIKIERNGEFDQHQKYPYELLKSEAECLPEGIDPKRKEIHLTHDDFVSIFKMPFSEFESLPSWRKQELKKKNKLF